MDSLQSFNKKHSTELFNLESTATFTRIKAPVESSLNGWKNKAKLSASLPRRHDILRAQSESECCETVVKRRQLGTAVRWDFLLKELVG